ncbi:uncharacterized protein BJX67DRAFT_378597 [Aspergillus lucknowensis]|uniref:Mid2 domain-containing protein n=1 Tax=Aspergillus lucknowensis TaxID=176173 RepID=A0ABR4LZX0_9EURO
MKRTQLGQFLPLAFLPLAKAKTVQDLWNLPDYPDYTTNFTAGTSVNISWQHDLVGQFQFFCEDCDVTNVDLWLTGSSYTRKLEGASLHFLSASLVSFTRAYVFDPRSQSSLAGVNVNTTSSYNWTIGLSNDDVEASTDWTLRFLPADIQWGVNNQEISSAKFNINPRPPQSSPTASPSPSPTATSPANPGDEEDGGLSTGAKAGIGVGVGAGGLIIIALAFLLWRRLRALPDHKTPGAAAAAGYNDLYHPPPPGEIQQYQAQEGFYAPPLVKTPPAPPAPPSELHGDAARELDAGTDGQRAPVELDASTHTDTQR